MRQSGKVVPLHKDKGDESPKVLMTAHADGPFSHTEIETQQTADEEVVLCVRLYAVEDGVPILKREMRYEPSLKNLVIVH